MSTKLTRPCAPTWVVTFAESPSMGAGSVILGTIYPDGLGAPGESRIVIPSDEDDFILRIKSAGVVANGADGDIIVVVNGVPQPVLCTVSSCSAEMTNGQGKIIDPVIPLPRSSNVQFRLVLHGAPAGNVTQQIWVEVQRVPVQ